MKRLLPLIALLACTPSNPRQLSIAGLKHHLAEPMQQPAAAVDLDPSPEVLRIVLRAVQIDDRDLVMGQFGGDCLGIGIAMDEDDGPHGTQRAEQFAQ